MGKKKLFKIVNYFYRVRVGNHGLFYRDEGVFTSNLLPNEAFNELKRRFETPNGKSLVEFLAFNRL